MKAAEVMAGKWYRTRSGKRVYIYPRSKAPNACGMKPEMDRVPYRSDSEYLGGRTIYGHLPGDYILFPLLKE